MAEIALIDNNIEWNRLLSGDYLIQVFVVLSFLVLGFCTDIIMFFFALPLLLFLVYEAFDRIGVFNKNLYLITGVIILALMSLFIYLSLIKGFNSSLTNYLIIIVMVELSY